MVTRVPRLLRFTVAPFTPKEVLMPLLLRLILTPGAILMLFLILRAMTRFL